MPTHKIHGVPSALQSSVERKRSAASASTHPDLAFDEQDMRRLDARAVAASGGRPADAELCIGSALPQLDDRRRITLNAISLEQAPEGWRAHHDAVPSFLDGEV